ncbi:hypothetical protein HMPREF1326_01779 [Akkermansia sp. KLE1605]|nr:hypothetical protein HMPREF1326_01779 [Akkermansia sp. KLE1605]
MAKLGDFFDPLLSCFVSGTHGASSVCTERADGKSPVRLFARRFCFSWAANPVQGKALSVFGRGGGRPGLPHAAFFTPACPAEGKKACFDWKSACQLAPDSLGKNHEC